MPECAFGNFASWRKIISRVRVIRVSGMSGAFHPSGHNCLHGPPEDHHKKSPGCESWCRKIQTPEIAANNTFMLHFYWNVFCAVILSYSVINDVYW